MNDRDSQVSDEDRMWFANGNNNIGNQIHGHIKHIWIIKRKEPSHMREIETQRKKMEKNRVFKKWSADDEDENVMKLVFAMKFQLKSSDSAW